MIPPCNHIGNIGNGYKVVSCFLFKMIIICYQGDTMTEKKQINLRLTEKNIEKLKVEANEQKRSVNNLIEIMIEKYFKEKSSNDQN